MTKLIKGDSVVDVPDDQVIFFLRIGYERVVPPIEKPDPPDEAAEKPVEKPKKKLK